MKSETYETAVLKGGDVQVWLERHDVIVRGAIVEGAVVKLTPVEHKLLELFLENQRTALSREYLITNGSRGEVHLQNKSLNVYVHRLRQKIEADPSNPRHIITVRSYGYRFDPQG
jgi:DNA-binding response OmpR family regulator